MIGINFGADAENGTLIAWLRIALAEQPEQIKSLLCMHVTILHQCRQWTTMADKGGGHNTSLQVRIPEELYQMHSMYRARKVLYSGHLAGGEVASAQECMGHQITLETSIPF